MKCDSTCFRVQTDVSGGRVFVKLATAEYADTLARRLRLPLLNQVRKNALKTTYIYTHNVFQGLAVRRHVGRLNAFVSAARDETDSIFYLSTEETP